MHDMALWMKRRHAQYLMQEHPGKPLTDIEIRRVMRFYKDKFTREYMAEQFQIPRSVIDLWLDNVDHFTIRDCLRLYDDGHGLDYITEWMRVSQEDLKSWIKERDMNRPTGYRSEKEQTLTERIINKLNTLPNSFFWQTVAKNGGAGQPDIIGLYKNKMVGIEVKTIGGLLKDHQRSFLNKMKSVGAIIGIARSVEQALDIVRSIDK